MTRLGRQGWHAGMHGLRHALMAATGTAALLQAAPAAGQGATVYRCPGPPVLYTDAITPEEARDRGCRTIEGAPVTVMHSPRPRPAASGPAAGGTAGAPSSSGPAGARPSDLKVDPKDQRARDSDRRAVLEAELRREQDRLAGLQREYNAGEPERRGDERNFARYQERVADLKASITRKEGDIAAIKRELDKLPAD